MKKILTTLIIVFAAFAAQAQDTLPIQSVLASSTSDANNPALAVLDGNTSTGWKLQSGNVSGWLQLNLASPAAISGIQWSGTLGSYTTATLWYQQAGVWKPFLAPALTATGFVDLSLDAVVATGLQIRLDGNDAASSKITEVQVLGKSSDNRVVRVHPSSISASDNTVWSQDETNLDDGNSTTTWKVGVLPWTETSDDDDIASWWQTQKKLTRYHDPSGQASAILAYTETVKLDFAKIYLPSALNTDLYLETQNGSSWTQLAHWGAGTSAGWQRVSFQSVNTQKLRLRASLGFLGSVEVGELEVWGHGTTQGRNPTSILTASTDLTYYSANTIFNSDGFSDGEVLFIVNNTSATSLSVNLNGNALSASLLTSLRGRSIYALKLTNGQLWTGDNFLRINQASGTLEDVQWALCVKPGLVDRGTGSLGDRLLYSGSAPDGTNVLTLANPTQLERLEVTAGHSLSVSAWALIGSSWTPLNPVYQSNGLYSFDGAQILTSQVKIAITGGAGEVTVWGSESNSAGPVVKILAPNDFGSVPISGNNNFNSGKLLVGWVSDPNAQIKVSGLSVNQRGHLFWIPLANLNLVDGVENLVTITAKDSQNRTTSVAFHIEYDVASGITLDQADATAYTAAPVFTISGSTQNGSDKVLVNGLVIAVSGKKFSTTVALAEGLNLITIQLQKSNGTVKSNLIRKVVRIAGGLFLAVDAPQDNGILNATSVNVIGRVKGVGAVSVQISVNGAAPISVQASAGAFAASNVVLKEGKNTLAVTAIDSIGETYTKVITVTRDTSTPQITSIVPTSGSLLATHIVTVTVNVTASTSSWVSIGGGSWIPVANGQAQASIALSEGAQTVTIIAKNAAGTTTTALLNLTTDTIAPALFTITSNVIGWTSNNRPILSFSTTDSGSGLDHWELSVDGTPWVVATSPYQVPTLSDGTHVVIVKAFDKAGNFTTVQTTLQIDTTAPVAVQNLRGIPGDGTMDVVWTTTDTDIVKYHVMRTPAWSDGEHVVTTPELKETGLTNGTTYSYTVWGEDHAANLGPHTAASQSITGISVQKVSTQTDVPTLLEYQGMKVIVPQGVLPPEDKVIVARQITSQALNDSSNSPIIGPIISISTIAQDPASGTLYETSHTEFQKDVVVALDYDASLIPNGFPESNLGVYYWDTTWSKWFRVPKSAVDTQNKKIVFFTNHFTDFSVQPTMVNDLSPQQLKDVGHNPNKTESSSGSVTVSPQGGTAMTEVTDFVLQGRNGFTLPIKRIYDTSTALADSPSISLNLSITLGLGDLASLGTMAAQIGSQLVSGGVSNLVGPIKAKVNSFLQHNGDYALSTGVGWRLNLPYVIASDSSVMIRVPSGGYYNVNQLSNKTDLGNQLNPFSRTLEFEMHEGDDFHFKVSQVKGFIAITDITTGQGQQALADLVKAEVNSAGSASLQTLGNSLTSWTTIGSELWTKDGTHYYFDSNGRIIKIDDKTGLDHFVFHYNGLLLSDVTDDLGRQVQFQYSSSSLAAVFAKPVITKISSAGFQGETREVNFNYDFNASNDLWYTFNFLPPLTSTTDPMGRVSTYSNDRKFMITGGGSVKINFLALLLDVIPGAGFLNSLLGISDLTLAGHLDINFPYLLSRVEAPGVGVTELSVNAHDLTQFKAEGDDWFLGLFPTALKISYDVIFRLETDQVRVTSSTGVVKTTTYTYNWISNNYQFYVQEAKINDGRTIRDEFYDTVVHWRYRYVSIDDWLSSGVIQSGGIIIFEVNSLLASVTTYDATTNNSLESTTNSWDTEWHHLIGSTTYRGPQTVSQTTTYYDNWGNQIYNLEDQIFAGREQKIERWNWYLNTLTFQPAQWTAGALDGDDSFSSETHDLLKGTITRNYLPAEAGGGYEDRFQGYAYNGLGLKKSEALWLGDHWSKTSYTYFTDSSLPYAGALQSKTGPLAGQVTNFTYDYSRGGNFYTQTETTIGIIDPTGNPIADIVRETAADWNTNWKLYDKDALGFVTSFAYDKLGRVTDTIKPGDESPLHFGNWNVVRTNASWEHDVYDDNALTVSLFKAPYTTGGNSSPGNLLEKYTYDNLGQLIQIEKFNYLGVATPDDAKTLATYTPWGDVATMTDPNGNRTSYAYEAKGRLALVTRADGSTVTTTYDDTLNQKITTNEKGTISLEYMNWKEQSWKTISDFGGVNAITKNLVDGLGDTRAFIDPLSQQTTTTINPFGKLSRVVHPDVAVGPSQSVVTLVEIFTYDDAGELTKQQVGEGVNLRETSFTYDLAGRQLKKIAYDRQEWNWYDANGQLVKHADALAVQNLMNSQTTAYSFKTYTSRGQLASQTDPTGATVRYAYDFKDRKVQMKDPRSSINPGITDSFTLNYTYNDLDRLVGADLPPVVGSPRSTIQVTYDLRGNATKEIDQAGRTTVWTFDNRNRKTSQSVTGADGTGPVITAWGWDKVGNQITEILVSNLNTQHPEQSTGVVTTKQYDGLDRVTDVNYPDGRLTHTVYDNLGRATSVSDAKGYATTTQYNSLNKPVLVTDPKGNTIVSQYDVWGEGTGSTIANPQNGDQIWTRVFDHFGQLTSEANNGGQSWSYLYDPRGLVSQVTDPNGTVTVNQYDLAGRILSKKLTNGAASQSQSWQYDLAGALKIATDGSVSTKLNQASGSFIADPYDLVNSVQTVVGSKTLNVGYTYDNAHNLTSVRYPDNDVINYQYNGLEQLVTVPGFALNGQYNFMGRLTSLTANNTTKREKTWNPVTGNLDAYTWNVIGKTPRTLGWDNEGNIVTQTKDGTNSNYIYDQLNWLTYAYEGMNVEVQTGSQYPLGYQQRDVGGQKALDFSNPNQTVKLDYYSSSVGVNLGSSQNVNKVRLGALGARLIARTVELYVSQDGSDNSWTEVSGKTWLQDQTGITIQLKTPYMAQFIKLHLTWDERDENNDGIDNHTIQGHVAQLFQVWFTVNGQTSVWTYDALGNRMTEDKTRGSEVLTNYSYYPNTSRIKQSGNWAFQYDPNGNLLSRGNSFTWDNSGNPVLATNSGEVFTYSYDLLNRLTEVKHSAAGTLGLQSVVTYVYDAKNLRVSQTKQGITTYYQFDQKGSLLYRDNGSEQRKYVEALGQIWAEVRTIGGYSTTYWHHTDHEGTTNAITDSNGHIVWDGDYEAFGSLVRSNGSIDFDASYTGKEFDKDTGLYYYNARFYDPTQGRFISEDPARDGDDWYLYAEDNPLKYVDPSGLAWVPWKVGSWGSRPPISFGYGGLEAESPASNAAFKSSQLRQFRAVVPNTSPETQPAYQKPASPIVKEAETTVTSKVAAAPANTVKVQSIGSPEAPVNQVPVVSPPKGSANPNTAAAAARGSTLHSDKPGNLPDQLRNRYPDTKFDFTKPGKQGQDVTVRGGTHPSDYTDSTWQQSVNRGDFKPDTPGGRRTFASDQKNKWSEPTQMLPYDPKTGKLK